MIERSYVYNPGRDNQMGRPGKSTEGGHSSLGPHSLLHGCPSLLSSLQGFEPRDTEISRKLEVWKAMQALTGPRNLFSLSPDPEMNR